jgi:hypothetical protein
MTHRHPPPRELSRGASRIAVVKCPAADRESGPALDRKITLIPDTVEPDCKPVTAIHRAGISRFST